MLKWRVLRGPALSVRPASGKGGSRKRHVSLLRLCQRALQCRSLFRVLRCYQERTYAKQMVRNSAKVYQVYPFECPICIMELFLYVSQAREDSACSRDSLTSFAARGRISSSYAVTASPSELLPEKAAFSAYTKFDASLSA
jgi:hypothetical protein